MSLQPFDERQALNIARLVVPADGIASFAFVPINSNDRRFDAITVSNRDGIAHVINLIKVNGGVSINLGSLSVPAGQGYLGTPSLDLLAAILPPTMVGLILVPGDTLNLQLAVAVVATFDMSVAAFGGVF